jgi:hypothetical protein
MYKILIFFISLLPLDIMAQIQKEANIPFTQDTDSDTKINVIDTDDDNDGVLDNDDIYPLNGSLSGPILLTTVSNGIADAGLRNNTSGNANSNYGNDAVVQTKGPERSYILKFNAPPSPNITSATLRFYTKTENDPLQIFKLGSSNWIESSITFNSNLANYNGRELIGSTGAPSGGVYTFNIPLNVLENINGAFTLLIYDPNDPSGATEELFTREEATKPDPNIEYSYFENQLEKVVLQQAPNTYQYLGNGSMQIGFKLLQAPTSTVYIPFEISDTSIAKISGPQVLTFTNSNWNTPQNITINFLEIGSFILKVRPLHSGDIYYNGHNPKDLPTIHIQSVDLVGLPNPFSLQTLENLDYLLNPVSSNGSTKYTYKILSGPVGLNVVENTGRLSFRPTSRQAGTHSFTIQITDEFGNVSIFSSTIVVTDSGASNPTGIYVIPGSPQDPSENGSVEHPFNNIIEALNVASFSGGHVFIRGGEYTFHDVLIIHAQGYEENPIIISPFPGEHVKLNFDGRSLFEFSSDARHIVIENFEIDGGTDAVDFWCIVAQAFWGDPSVPRGGGLAIVLDGEYLTARHNYIHDCYQKAVEIPGGRYVKVYNNIIHNIATTSLSGGHGIMRQQKGREFFNDDLPNLYRWDIMNNYIYNVEQRIYSWVPAKGFIEMVLDEGKPILIDDPKDTDGVQEGMKARIKNNIVAYGSIDQIRLKSTPNLEVSNNTVFSQGDHADGITDKVGDTNTPKFHNFTFKDNAVQTQNGTLSFEIADAVSQAGTGLVINGNMYAQGSISPSGQAGITNVNTNQLFIDPLGGNFRLNPALGLPTKLGVAPSVIDSIDASVSHFGAKTGSDRWDTDHLTLVQTILDNIPGVNDGISNNETVFTDAGDMNADHTEIEFDVVNGAWKALTASPSHQEFHLNPEYATWYHISDALYKNEFGQDYERIRWGNSHLKQNQLFDNDWLTISQITSDTTNTVITGKDHHFTLDGDLLIDFEGYSPSIGDTFYLMCAKTISTLSNPHIFDTIKFEGFIPESYSLEIVNYQNGQAVRLVIGNQCNLTVTSTDDAGSNTLRAAIECASDGDVIHISNTLQNDTIKITSNPIIINKNISIIGDGTPIYIQNCTSMPFLISADAAVTFSQINLLSDKFVNKGILTLDQVILMRKNGMPVPEFINDSGATVNIENNVTLK